MGPAAIERGEAVLALLRRLRTRPVVPSPERPETHEELFARIDAPRQAAAMTEERYAELLSGPDVRWKSVLAFLTQDEDGAVTRAFWIDPLRLRCFGCRLVDEDLDVLAPFFGIDKPTTPAEPPEGSSQVFHSASRLLAAMELVRDECAGRSDRGDEEITIAPRQSGGARRAGLKLLRPEKEGPAE